MSQRVLVTGANGFHGSAILRALRATDGMHSSGFVRNAGTLNPEDRIEAGIGDIRDARAVRSASVGVDAVVHSASYVGYDPEACREVNVTGTMNVTEAARRNGVKLLIYISTAGVYGSGPLRGLTEDQSRPAPNSVLSQSRLDAERIVQDFGGIIIRPHLVYGAGDRWVIPSIVRLTKALGARVGDGTAQLSVISAANLGHLVASLVGSSSRPPERSVLHAANSAPVLVDEIIDEIIKCTKTPMASRQPARLSLDEAFGFAESIGLTANQIRLVSSGSWYNSDAIWRHAQATSPTRFELSELDVAWYGAQSKFHQRL